MEESPKTNAYQSIMSSNKQSSRKEIISVWADKQPLEKECRWKVINKRFDVSQQYRERWI